MNELKSDPVVDKLSELTKDIDFADDAEQKRFELSDVGNAERMVYYYGHEIKYNHDAGKWYVWNGQRWEADTINKVTEFAKRLVFHIRDESKDVPEHRVKDYLKFATSSMAEDRIRKAINLSKSDPVVAVTYSFFDSNNMLLNVKNGIIDLETLEIIEHDPKNGLSKIANVKYDPDAKCPIWEEFLKTIFVGDMNLIKFVQKALGYSMTGKTGERVFFILYGRGANGKSTLLNVIQAIFGDYAATTPVNTFLAKRDGIPNDLAALNSVRLVHASEAENRRRLAVSMVKQISGGDPVSARFLHQEWFTFTPQFKVFLATNYKPTIPGSDAAIWARIRLIPFNYVIPESERIPDLHLELLNEAPGILNWLLEGLRMYKAERLKAPDAVKQATNDYKEESDELNGFLDDFCIKQEGTEVKSSTLYAQFKKWNESNGTQNISNKMFSELMTGKGFTKVRKANGVFWQNIGLLE